MFKPEEYQGAIAHILALWGARTAKYVGWHGFGISGNGKPEKITLYVEPRRDLTALLNDAKVSEGPQPNGLPIDVLRVPRFCQIPGTAQVTDSAPALNGGLLRPGEGIFSCSASPVKPPDKDRCAGSTGTLGAFLTPAGANHADPIWLLSCRHVLLPVPICNEGLIIKRENPSAKVGDSIKSPNLNPQGSLVDAAVARLSKDLAIDPSTPEITIESQFQSRPNTDSLVQKFGKVTHRTSGILLHFAPRIELTPDGAEGATVFEDQMLIQASSSAHFADAGDSGSLLVTQEQRAQPIGLIIGMIGPPNSPCGNFIVATPLDTVLNKLSKELEPELGGRTLELMLKPRQP
jgi:hypothetical protein